MTLSFRATISNLGAEMFSCYGTENSQSLSHFKNRSMAPPGCMKTVTYMTRRERDAFLWLFNESFSFSPNRPALVFAEVNSGLAKAIRQNQHLKFQTFRSEKSSSAACGAATNGEEGGEARHGRCHIIAEVLQASVLVVGVGGDYAEVDFTKDDKFLGGLRG